MALCLQAHFTSTMDSTQPWECAQKGCKIKWFPPGIDFMLVEDHSGAKISHWICAECFNYYTTKADSKIIGILLHV